MEISRIKGYDGIGTKAFVAFMGWMVDGIARLHSKVLWRYCLMILCDSGA